MAGTKRVPLPRGAAVNNAVAVATEDALGAWLARNWGVLAETPPDVLDQMDL